MTLDGLVDLTGSVRERESFQRDLSGHNMRDRSSEYRHEPIGYSGGLWCGGHSLASRNIKIIVGFALVFIR